VRHPDDALQTEKKDRANEPEGRDRVPFHADPKEDGLTSKSNSSANSTNLQGLLVDCSRSAIQADVKTPHQALELLPTTLPTTQIKADNFLTFHIGTEAFRPQLARLVWPPSPSPRPKHQRLRVVLAG
jgi:hypothetical protein